MDQEYIHDKHRKIDILPTFFGTAGEVINGIEDPMSSAVDPAKNMAPSIAVEALKVASMDCSGVVNFSAAASIGSVVEMIGLQGVKENRECPVIISRGNMFAKKINIGDNFSGFDEYINKYMDFVYGIEDCEMELMPTEEVKRLERIFVRLKNTKGFFEEVLEEKDD
jgi:hypothetical protein